MSASDQNISFLAAACGSVANANFPDIETVMSGETLPRVTEIESSRRVWDMAERIQVQLGKNSPPTAAGTARVLGFLRSEFQTGVFARLMEMAVHAEKKLQQQRNVYVSYEEFLAEMNEIVGPRENSSPVERDDPSVRGIASRFFDHFKTDQIRTDKIIDRIEDTLRAEFGFGAFCSAGMALRHLNLVLEKADWPNAEEYRNPAREIESLFSSLSTPRPGSSSEEVYQVVFAHEAAQAGKEFFNRSRADYEIHGAAPHQWVVYLDPNRPVDPNRPWEKPNFKVS